MSFIVKERLEQELKEVQQNVDTPGLLWKDIFAIIKKMKSIVLLRGKCRWSRQDDEFANVWTSECGLTWQMGDDSGPNKNRMYFCPQCGQKLIEEEIFTEDEDDDETIL